MNFNLEIENLSVSDLITVYNFIGDSEKENYLLNSYRYLIKEMPKIKEISFETVSAIFLRSRYYKDICDKVEYFYENDRDFFNFMVVTQSSISRNSPYRKFEFCKFFLNKHGADLNEYNIYNCSSIFYLIFSSNIFKDEFGLSKYKEFLGTESSFIRIFFDFKIMDTILKDTLIDKEKFTKRAIDEIYLKGFVGDKNPNDLRYMKKFFNSTLYGIHNFMDMDVIDRDYPQFSKKFNKLLFKKIL